MSDICVQIIVIKMLDCSFMKGRFVVTVEINHIVSVNMLMKTYGGVVP